MVNKIIGARKGGKDCPQTDHRVAETVTNTPWPGFAPITLCLLASGKFSSKADPELGPGRRGALRMLSSTQATLLRMLDWFVPPLARSDEATLGRARIFAFSHLFGPFLGHAISVYLYFESHQRGVPFWVIVTCITLFWTLPFLLKASGRLQLLALFSVC